MSFRFIKFVPKKKNMEITREQAYNYLHYFSLMGKLEFQFSMAFPKIFEQAEENVEFFQDDQAIENMAEHIGFVINQMNLSDSGEDNKTTAIFQAARAFVRYLDDKNNPAYCNDDGYWRICSYIARNI